MRCFASLTLALVCALAVSMRAQTTPTEEQQNNTPACAATGTPSYCYLPANGQPPLSTATANQNPDINPPIQTVTVDAVGHIEAAPYLPISRLVPNVGSSAWAGKVICEYQPWFSVNPNPSFLQQNGTYAVPAFNGHLDIGYDEDADDPNNLFNSSAPTQDTEMINQGCNIDLIDFYGFIAPVQDFNQDTTNNVYGDLASRAANGSYPMQFAIMEDKGAFQAECNASSDNLTEETCIEDAIESEMSNISEKYILPHPGLYWTDGGINVVAIFASCSDFSPSASPPGQLICPTKNDPEDDWQTIWTTLINDGLGSQYNMKFIFEYGQFGYPAGASSGQYAWPQPFSGITNGPNCQSAKNCFIDYPYTQFWWCDPGNAGTELPCEGEGSGSQAYLDRFYTDAAMYVPEGQIAVGAIYKGFDDSNAGWWSDRVIAQQCGAVLLGTAGELTYEANPNNTSYWATHQMPYMQVVTWNDYEEGTEVESGIDNCLAVSNVQVQEVQGIERVTWTVTSSSPGYGTTSTIDHFVVWWGNADGSTTAPIYVAYTTPSGSGSTTSIPVSDLNLPRPAPDYAVDLWVEAVGVPLVLNKLSQTPYTYQY